MQCHDLKRLSLTLLQKIHVAHFREDVNGQQQKTILYSFFEIYNKRSAEYLFTYCKSL